MLPQTHNIPDGYDKEATLGWVDSLITSENLPTILTHYNFLYYIYRRQDIDPDGMHNYHYFNFLPKDRKQLTPEVMGKIFEELFKRSLITEPMDESQYWEFRQDNYNLCIILKATD